MGRRGALNSSSNSLKVEAPLVSAHYYLGSQNRPASNQNELFWAISLLRRPAIRSSLADPSPAPEGSYCTVLPYIVPKSDARSPTFLSFKRRVTQTRAHGLPIGKKNELFLTCFFAATKTLCRNSGTTS